MFIRRDSGFHVFAHVPNITSPWERRIASSHYLWESVLDLSLIFVGEKSFLIYFMYTGSKSTGDIFCTFHQINFPFFVTMDQNSSFI